jgi:Four helix bundle sensory module for signal transduction
MSQQRGPTTPPYYTPPVQKTQAASSTPAVSQTKPPTPSTQSGLSSNVQNPSLGLLERLWLRTRKTLKGQFSVVAVVTLLLALVLAWFLSQSFLRASDDLNTIASGSIPSVDAAQALAQYIDDIDAKAADFLGTASIDKLSSCSVPSAGQPITVAGQTVSQCDKLTIDAEFLLANQQLFNAAHNVTYPGERTAIERITEGLEEYSGHLTVMMREFDLAANKGDATDPHLKAAYQAYLDAGNVLHTQIERQPKTPSGVFAYSEPANTVPTCQPNYPDGPTLQPDGPNGGWATGSLETNIDCLSAINHLHLDAAYNDTMSFTGITFVLTIAFCLIFCILLLFATGRMMIITHRVINPGLTLALVASIILSVASISVFASLQGKHGAYGQLVKDDYQSVYAANLLKRVGTNANADESRWLIALKFSNTAEAQRWQTDWEENTNKVNSLIKQAQANRTWPEEDQPLQDIPTNWNTYYRTDDPQIRSMANNGDLQQAETLSTGDSNRAFGKFTDAVDQLKKANYDHYSVTLNATQNTLNVYILLSAIIFPLIGLAAVWGISQRFKDL